MNKTSISLLTLIPIIFLLSSCTSREPTISALPTAASTTDEFEPTSTPERPVQTNEQATEKDRPFYLQLSSQQTQEELKVLGLLRNVSNSSYSDIEIQLSLIDPDHRIIDSILIKPTLGSIPSGEASPFEGKFPGSFDPSVMVAGEVIHFSPSEAQKINLQIENKRLFRNQSQNTMTLTGKIINHHEFPVLIHSLSAVIQDEFGTVQGISSDSQYVQYLDPYETTPFMLGVDNLYLAQNEDYEFVMFSDVQQVAYYPVYAVDFDENAETNITSDGRFQLMVRFENRDTVPVHITVVAGIFNENGDVLDVSSFSSNQTAILPGETQNVNFTEWENLTKNPELISEISTYSVQWDPARTHSGE